MRGSRRLKIRLEVYKRNCVPRVRCAIGLERLATVGISSACRLHVRIKLGMLTFKRIHEKLIGKKLLEGGQIPCSVDTIPAPLEQDVVDPLRPQLSVLSLSDDDSMQSVYSDELPCLQEVDVPERKSLFLRKLFLCHFCFNFGQPGFGTQKQRKQETLCEVVEALAFGVVGQDEETSRAVVAMVAANLFRSLPTVPTPSASMEVDAMAYYDPAWPHLQLVYEVFLRLLALHESREAKESRRLVDKHFVLQFLALFDSPDPRERDYCKAITHRIYGRYMHLRHFIRRAICSIFHTFVLEDELHYMFGIGELLEILGSIINGFALPLKHEHKSMLVRSLLPLLKPRGVAFYQQQLMYCISEFVQKDVALAAPALSAILRYWPVTNCAKEVLFISEVEHVLQLVQPCDVQPLLLPVFKRIATGIKSPHFQVAERALSTWCDGLLEIVSEHRMSLFPCLVEALETNAQQHWHSIVLQLTDSGIKLLQELDLTLYEACKRELQMQSMQQRQRELTRHRNWSEVERLAEERRIGLACA